MCLHTLPMAHVSTYLPGIRTTIPRDGLAGLRENWRQDALAGLVAFLVSLPLSIGIALASGAPAVAGIITAIIGGLLVSLINGSFLTVNAPAPGLIIIMYQAAVSLGSGDAAAGYPHVLAVTVIAGLLLIVVSRFALNQLVALVPESVVHGLMAAVGLTVLSKEIHTALGTKANGDSAFELLLAFPQSLASANKDALIISGVCLTVLALSIAVPKKLRKKIPIPVVAVAIGAVLGSLFHLPPSLRVQMPTHWSSSIVFADFSKALTTPFLSAVVTLTLVQGLESILSAAAVERLDPYRRRTNQKRDLAAVGFGSTLSGAIGGLPIIASIVRGAAVVNAGGRTRWANFFNGICMLICLLALSGVIRQLPLAALAAVLLATAYQLTSFQVWKKALAQGRWSFYVFVATVIGCLATDLLIGVGLGLLTHLVLHVVRGASPGSLFVPILDIEPEADGDTVYVHFRQSAALSNEAALRRRLRNIPTGKFVIMDFTDANLRDLSVVEQVREFAEEYAQSGGVFDYIGLPGDTSEHLATRRPTTLEVGSHPIPTTAADYHRRELSRLAVALGADFLPNRYAAHARLVGYPRFKHKRVKYAENTLQGPLPCATDRRYTVKDLTVLEYEGIASQEYKVTVWLSDNLPNPLPVFSLRHENVITRLYDYIGFSDINFSEYPIFSGKYELMGPDPAAIRTFFSNEIIEYLEAQNLPFHLESNGHGLILFTEERLLNPSEIRELHTLGCGLLDIILKQAPTTPRPTPP